MEEQLIPIILGEFVEALPEVKAPSLRQGLQFLGLVQMLVEGKISVKLYSSKYLTIQFWMKILFFNSTKSINLRQLEFSY